MNLVFCRVGRAKFEPAWNSLITSYLNRIRQYTPIHEDIFLSEDRLFSSLERKNRSFYLVLLDQRGKQLSSTELAEQIRVLQDAVQNEIVFCIGPADGFSDSARKKANLMLSFGAMTLPHQMAALVLVEQLYRAFTILAGHPYHSGH